MLADVRLGDTLRRRVEAYLADLDAAELADVLTAGLAHEELRTGAGLTYTLDGPARLRHRPAAEPALHPRLQRVGARPGRRHEPGDAGPAARDDADPGDLRLPPAVRRHGAAVRADAGARRGRRRAAARARRARRRRRRADDARPGSSGWPGGCSSAGWRTPCWPSRSPRSGRRCTWTPSARWSTSTPSSCTRTSPHALVAARAHRRRRRRAADRARPSRS